MVDELQQSKKILTAEEFPWKFKLLSVFVLCNDFLKTFFIPISTSVHLTDI